MRTYITERGFRKAKFTDHFGSKCSIQKSSLATEEAIWIGVNDPNAMVMASDAAKCGIETTATSGWIAYPLPREVSITTRMHLTQDMVRGLLPLLTHFAETGELPEVD